MLIFSQFFWIIVLFLVFLMIFSLVFLWLTEREDSIKSIEIYIASLISLILFSNICEMIIYQNFRDSELVVLFDIELISILFLFTVLYFILLKNFKADYFIYIHSLIAILASHIFIAGVIGILLVGTIIITLIGALVFAIILPYDNEYKILAVLIIFSFLIYVSVSINALLLTIVLLIVLVPIISIGNESFRRKIVSLYLATKSSNKINLKIVKIFSREEKKEKVSYWLTKVKILQGALEKKEEPQVLNQEKETTWLQDFFSNKSYYGLELISQNDFNWTFLMKARTQNQARINGEALLTRLSSIYPGLDGEIEILPITKEKLHNKKCILEIKLPKPPYLEEFTLITDFINLFHRNKYKITLYIIWKKIALRKITKVRKKIEKMKYKDEKEKEQLSKMWQDDLFKIRIFINYEIIEDNPKLRENAIQIIEGGIRSLIMSSRNPKESARLEKIISQNSMNFFHFTLFSGHYVTPNCVDFNFPEVIPLIKPFTIEKENIKHRPVHETDTNHILIGRYIFNGRLTERKILVPKSTFSQSAVIFGQIGTGKTYLLSQVVNEFYNKAPDVGILIINLGKGYQEIFYQVDRVIKFGSSDFRVPYFVQGPYLEKNLQETAAYLIAALGLKNIVVKNMLNVMKSFTCRGNSLPTSLDILFFNLIKFFEQFPYHVKFQTNILRALQNRVLSLLTNEELKKILELTSEVPQWFQEWRNGKKIYLDLSMCNIYVKRLLTNAIFQLVRTLTPDIEAGTLRNIIIIDEAHQILEKSISRNYDDDDFISTEQLEKIFTELIREFRSKGLSFIIVEQIPSRLFEAVITLPSLKILFRLGYPCNTLFTGNAKEQNYLTLQKNRQALVLNGIIGEKYVIETLDTSIQPQIAYMNGNTKKLCYNCNSLIDYEAKYCMFCGKTLLPDLKTPSEDSYLDFFEIKEDD